MKDPDDNAMLVTLSVAQLRAVVADVALHAARKALAERGDGLPEVIDKHSACIFSLTPNAFLDAARADAFPSWTLGKRCVAWRRDVAAWCEGMQARPGEAAPKAALSRAVIDPGGVDPVADALEAGALRVVRGGRKP